MAQHSTAQQRWSGFPPPQHSFHMAATGKEAAPGVESSLLYLPAQGLKELEGKAREEKGREWKAVFNAKDSFLD